MDIVLEEAKERVSDSPGEDDILHLFSLTQHNFNPNCYHQVCYMFQRALRLPSGMSIQNTYKGRYRKDLNVHTIQLNLTTLKYLEHNPNILRNKSSNNTLFGKYVIELPLTIFLLTFFLPIPTHIFFEIF